ncbi:MAG TPA: P1 family peptidase [Usitatibacter sp.]|jgi:D-aminopeptidase|nr:P1 family peptidase [Usitatibacter sp.]
MASNDPPRIGPLAPGPRNAITDVDGVTVGHCTLARGDTQTGATVIVPHAGDPYRERPPAAAVVLNGFGKSAGLMQVEELGVIETPVALGNTFAVGALVRAQERAACRANPEIGRSLPTVNAVALECNDGYLNDIQAQAVGEAHYEEALAGASRDFAQGSVGAGRGMTMFGVKGGVGSASRVAATNDDRFMVGALVLANFGRAANLVVDGERVGARLHEALARPAPAAESGSIIMVLATDAPLDARQLRRVALRAGAGLARTGSFFGHGSGDVVLAFSTAYRIPHSAATPMPALALLHDGRLDPLFEAAADATEQAIVNALFSASRVRGFRGHERRAFTEVLPGWRVAAP